MAGGESSGQGAARNAPASAAPAAEGGGGAFPLNSIAVLESNLGYRRWKQDINNWLVLNNLIPFNAATNHRASTAIFHRLGDSGRELVEAEFDNKDPQAMLDALAKDYQPKGTGLYRELVRRMFSLTLGEGGVRQYEKDFRKVTSDINSLHKSLAIAEPLRILIFLMGLGESYDMFESSYTQNHELFGDKAVKFQEVVVAAVNEEARISSKEGGLAMYAARNGKGKGKQSASNHDHNSESHRETCGLCKSQGRKYRHPPDKCWTKFPHLKPEKFMTDEEKKKKKAKATPGDEPPSNKRKRIEEAPSNTSAPGEDDYLNANYAFVEELVSNMHYPDASPDDYNILGAADEQVINLIATESLDHGLMAADSVDLHTKVVVDSGCSRHSFADRSVFTTYEKVYSRPIKGIGGSEVQPLGCGTIKLECAIKGRRVEVTLRNVLHVPDMGVNLLSVGKLLDADIAVAFHKTGCSLTKGALELTGTRNRNLFFLDLWQSRNSALAAYSVPSDPIHQLWHARMGHLGQNNLNKLPSMAVGVDFTKDIAEEYTCECCVMGRQKAVSHDSPTAPGLQPGEFVYSDLVGPLSPTGFNGCRYFVTFKDDFTSYSEVYCIRHKSETFAMFLRFKAFLEARGYRICRIRLDNGREYISKAFLDYLLQCGIKQEPTVPGNPEMNGAAERFGQTLLYKMHPILLSSQLNKSFWPEIVATTNYLVLRSPNTRTPATPFEAFYHRRPILSHLRTIGSIAYALKRIQKKLVDKSEKCVLLGYEGESIFRLYNLTKKKVIRANDVHFVEKRPLFVDPEEETDAHEPPAKRQRLQQVPASAVGEALDGQRITDISEDVAPIVRAPASTPIQTPAPARIPIPATARPRPDFPWPACKPPPTPGPTFRSPAASPASTVSSPSTARGSISPSDAVEAVRNDPELSAIDKVLRDHPDLTVPDLRDLSPDPLSGAFAAFALLADHANKPDVFEPTTYEQAISNQLSRMNWELAMGDEYKSLMDNNTWCLVQAPPGAHVLRGRWVYTVKRGPAGEVTRYKARWVVRGFEQQEGRDYHDTFASVVKPMSYKAIFALAAALDWDVEQMDVKTAFLYGNVHEEIYVQQPDGFSKDRTKVCKLNKALYGLKQSPRIWYQHFSEYMKELGLVPIESDESVFMDAKEGTIVALYVDDVLITGPNKAGIQRVKKALNSKFHMSDLGPCAYYLGMTVKRDRAAGTLRLGQAAYVTRFLKHFNCWNLNPASTPLETSRKLQPAEEGYVAPRKLREDYQSAVGSLMYAMLGTRPDIAYAVSLVSRYSANPTQAHWNAVIRIFRYLRGTVHYELVYKGSLQELTGYTDSDWAGDSSRRSTSGYLFNVGSGAVSWSSKRQATVALSTCEAEYIGQTQATKEAIWLKNLLNQLLRPRDSDPKATVIFGDNQGAIALAKNAQFHARTKHIDIAHHFVREKVNDGTVDIQFVPTDKQMADGLTKALCLDKFVAFRDALGVESAPEHPLRAKD